MCTVFSSDFGTTEPQTNHSQYSSPVEALNLIVDSKSQPVELDSSTIGVTCAVEAIEKLSIYCSADFGSNYRIKGHFLKSVI